MASLVAAYGSDSEEEYDPDVAGQEPNATVTQVSEVKGKNFFDEGGSSDSSGEEVVEPENQQSKGTNSDKLPNPLMDTLPSFSNSVSNLGHSSGSVFTNKYDLAEKEKNAILEKHVKMTETKILTGKAGKICYKFTKGKCRFGKSCKYSHDLEANRIVTQSSNQSDVNNSSRDGNSFRNFNSHEGNAYINSNERTFTSPNRMYSRSNCTAIPEFGVPLQPETIDDDKYRYMASFKRKKRAGVSDHLVPPKRAMSALQKQREEERPWTVQK